MAIPSKAQSKTFFMRQSSLVTLRQAPVATNIAAVEMGALEVVIISTMASSFLSIRDGFISSIKLFGPTAETPPRAGSFRLSHYEKYWN
jgi:hypothetical protein